MKSQFPPKHVPLRPPPAPSPKYKPPTIPGRKPMGLSPGPAVASSAADGESASLYLPLRG